MVVELVLLPWTADDVIVSDCESVVVVVGGCLVSSDPHVDRRAERKCTECIIPADFVACVVPGDPATSKADAID